MVMSQGVILWPDQASTQDGTKEKICRGLEWDFQRYRGRGGLLVCEECQRRWGQETGNLAEGARRSSFERSYDLASSSSSWSTEYCVLLDTTHQYKEQGGLAHGDSWE